MAAAGYRDTEITQEHALLEKEGWVPVKPGQERERTHESRERREWVGSRAHVSRERRGWGGSQLSRDQTTRERERTHESRERREWGGSQLSRERAEKESTCRDSNITNKGHMRCNRLVISMQQKEITQEHGWGGSQLSRDQTTRERERERERERTHESRETREWGGSQLSRDRNKKEHMRAEKEGGGCVPVKPGLKHYKQGTHEKQSIGDFDATIAAAGYW